MNQPPQGESIWGTINTCTEIALNIYMIIARDADGIEHTGIMARKETVIQFGEGGFLRGFADYFFQKLRDKGLFDGFVVIVQPIEKGMCGVLAEQNLSLIHI